MGITEEEKKDLINYRLSKSRDVFQEALDVASMNHWNLAVNRLYYSVFHCCNALLLKDNNPVRTHSGVIRMIALNYVKNGKLSKEEGQLITTLFNMRHTGDYDDLFDWTQQQVEPLIEPSRNLINRIVELINI